ncbi:hypothetical protein NQ315_014424 [Exocentrus adspersus]|uniref:Uncharacterized protein n=1 Tax=Exocentrus adspersus TaxID=1586481 RepID=A0AAV8VBD8_9CUCU|nr:hypothetical protein NQ315_014424 [Exocentrus adspersus]
MRQRRGDTHTCKTHLKRIQTVENIALRTAVSAPWFVCYKELYRHLEWTPVQEVIKAKAAKVYAKATDYKSRHGGARTGGDFSKGIRLPDLPVGRWGKGIERWSRSTLHHPRPRSSAKNTAQGYWFANPKSKINEVEREPHKVRQRSTSVTSTHLDRSTEDYVLV